MLQCLPLTIQIYSGDVGAYQVQSNLCDHTGCKALTSLSIGAYNEISTDRAKVIADSRKTLTSISIAHP